MRGTCRFVCSSPKPIQFTAGRLLKGSFALFCVLTLTMPAQAAGKKLADKSTAAEEEGVSEPLLVIPETPAPPRKNTTARSNTTKATSTAKAAKDNAQTEKPTVKSTSTAKKSAPVKSDSQVIQTSASEERPAPKTTARPVAQSSTRPTAKSTAAINSEPVKAEPWADSAHYAEPAPRQHRPHTQPITAAEYEANTPSLFGNSAGRHRTVSYDADWRLASQESASEPVPAPEPSGEEPFMPYGGGDDTIYSPDDDDLVFDEMGDPFVLPGRRWTVIAGGEGMALRPHFSQAAGMTETITTQSGGTSVITQNIKNFNPGYQGAFRTYLGFRNCACGDEIRFTFFNYSGADNLRGTATANTQFCDFLCNQTQNPGDTVDTHFNLGASIWDLDCIRPFYFLPQCNDPCGPKCHPWDLRWFLGLRTAYINHNISSVVTGNLAADGIFTTASAANKFTGFGPRLGMQGRKYFGPGGRLSVYGRGAGSLLVGNVYQDVINSTSSGSALPVSSVLIARNSRIIPVAELEVGGTWWMLPRFAVSGGWMLMSFWDLGLQETGSMTTPILNNSNILGFDGFFLRGELVF